jgi:hypothetical protein
MSPSRSNRDANALPGKKESGTARVTLSVDPHLLRAVDHTAERTERSRSAVFEDALLLWYEKMQEEADRAFYSKESEDPAVQSWDSVITKAAGHLWDD